MKQVLLGGGTATLVNSATRYNSLFMSTNWVSDVYATWQGIGVAGTISSLKVVLLNAPGVNKQYVFTLMVNDNPTSLEVTIKDTSTSGEDTTHTASVNPGDRVNLRCVPTNTPNTGNSYWSSIFDSGLNNNANCFSGVYANRNETQYGFIQNPFPGYKTAVAPSPDLVVSGTLRNLYAHCRTAPPAGQKVDYYVYVNGSQTTVHCTITAGTQDASDTSHSVAISQGDVVMIQAVSSATAPLGNYSAVGIEFVPDTYGWSTIQMWGTANFVKNAKRYGALTYGNTTYPWQASTGNNCNIAQACLLKYWHVILSRAPGSGQQYKLTIYKNNSPTGITVTISGTAIEAQDYTNEVEVSDGDVLEVYCEASAAPATSNGYWEIGAYYAEPQAACFGLHPGAMAEMLS